MENLEEAAQQAAERWHGRKSAKEEMRTIAFRLLETKNMTETAKIIGVSRTSLYYFLYGRHGKAHAITHPHEHHLPVHDGALDLRESA